MIEVKRFLIIKFFLEYGEYLLHKTDYYNEYFKKDKTLNQTKIANLGNREIDELYNIIQNEKTYLPK